MFFCGGGGVFLIYFVCLFVVDLDFFVVFCFVFHLGVLGGFFGGELVAFVCLKYIIIIIMILQCLFK